MQRTGPKDAADLPGSNAQPCPALACLGFVGAAAFALALSVVQPVQFNVVTYTVMATQGGLYVPALVLAMMLFAALLIVAGRAARLAVPNVGPTFQSVERQAGKPVPHLLMFGSILWPLILSAPLACYAFVDAPPPFALSFLIILSAGWAAFRGASRLGPVRMPKGVALGSVVLLIVVLTVVHTRLQINYFEHFMLGHADFGHFTEELKNCLAGRGLRCDSFANVRLGWHFVPLMYVLAPGYALWPSPVYLMVCGALLVHLPALPAYFLARRLSGSTAVAWMLAVAWLLHPSQSRLVYANTYGFQFVYFAMPLLGVMISAGVLRRWRTSLVMMILVLLCKETTSAATLGWGLYVALCMCHRRKGLLIAVGSVVYLILCVKLFIPHFAVEGDYGRLELFGALGGSFGELLLSPLTDPETFFSRLVRGRAVLFVLMLIVPMALIPLKGWRMALAALPTLLLVLLIEEADQLTIKFWHQATLLPLLFFAGIASMGSAGASPSPGTSARAKARGCPILAKQGWGTDGPLDQRIGFSVRHPSPRAKDGAPALSGHNARVGLAAATLCCAAWGHYFYGFSPISKPFEPYANAAFLHTPDPRMETVRRLRSQIPGDRTILASERLAAHFTDFKRLYTGGRAHQADFVIIDRSDTWDTSGLVGRVARFTDDPNYRLYGQYGPIIVFARAEDAPPVPLDD